MADKNNGEDSLGRDVFPRVEAQVNHYGDALFSGMDTPYKHGCAIFCDGLNNLQGAMQVYVKRTERGYDVRLAIMDGVFALDACRTALDVVVNLVDDSFDARKVDK